MALTPNEGRRLSQFNKGESDLTKLAATWDSLAEWEARAGTIRQGILSGAGLVPLPAPTALNATNHSQRAYTNYTVENVFFESLPGFFVSGNLYRLLADYRLTERRARALENVILPEIEQSLKVMTTHLEELEFEDAVRVRRQAGI